MNNSILLTLASGKAIHKQDLADIAALSLTELDSRLLLLVDTGITLEQENDAVRWVNPFNCLDDQLILNDLTEYQDLSVTVVDTVSSTNSTLAEIAMSQGAVLVAEHQSAGRGRHQRQWQSPVGKNVYLSYAWKLKLELLHPAISLCIGSAIVSVLHEIGVISAGMKWPNDLYVGQSKIGGILIESRTDSKAARLVIGVGINVHRHLFSDAFAVPATNIEQETGKVVDRNILVTKIVSAIHEVITQIETGEIDQLLLGWSNHDLSYNQPVDVHAKDNVLKGIARGIDTMGNLQVEINGELQVFNSADISLRITE